MSLSCHIMSTTTLEFPLSITLTQASQGPLVQLVELELLVFQLAFKLLGLGDLAHSLVQIILVDRVPVVFDSKETPTRHTIVSGHRRARSKKDSKLTPL